MSFEAQPELDPWWAASRQEGRNTGVHSIQEEAYSKALEEEVRQNWETLPRSPDRQKVVRNQEEEGRNTGADNNPPLVVAAVVERLALTRVQELLLQNLVLHRSVGAKLRLHLLQVERRKLSILLMRKTYAD
jgi:hypothetical protein